MKKIENDTTGAKVLYELVKLENEGLDLHVVLPMFISTTYDTTCKYIPSFSNFTYSYNNLAPVVAFSIFSYVYIVYQFDNVTQQLPLYD